MSVFQLNLEAKEHYREMEHYNSKAEQAIFAHYNNAANTAQLQQVDLHGLFVSEALVRARAHLEACRKARVSRTTFITGRGNRSIDGVAKIKAAVQDWLKEEQGVTVDESETEKNPGIVVAVIEVDSTPPEGDGDAAWPWKAGETVAWAVMGTVKSLFALASTAPQSVSTGSISASNPQPLKVDLGTASQAPLAIEPPKSSTPKEFEVPPSPAPPGVSSEPERPDLGRPPDHLSFLFHQAFNQKLPPVKAAANEDGDDDWEVVAAPVARQARPRPATKAPRAKTAVAK